MTMVTATVSRRDNGTDMNDATAPGLALLPAELVKLQTWFSPSFPVGAFSYSHGLEWAVESGDVRTAQSLGIWIDGVLRFGAGLSDAIVLCAIWRSLSSRDYCRAREIGSLAVALQPTAERRSESLGQGAAFSAAVASGWPHPRVPCFVESPTAEITFSVAVGAAAVAHGLPLDAVLVAYLHAFAANLVSAGIRLVPLGQTDGLRITAALEPAILEIARNAHAARFEDLGSCSMLADIASMRHETQYSRLFRS